MRTTSKISFTVNPGKERSKYFNARKRSLKEHLEKQSCVQQTNGKIIKTTESENMVAPALNNGFVGAAFSAYNKHLNWEISPDDVWVSIIAAFAIYVDKNAEMMRPLFVSHEGQKELIAYSSGDIYSADYDDMISQLTKQIDEQTLSNVAPWIECNFSTTTKKSRTVSKLILMGTMKNYFAYKMCMLCGLPGVTLLGTLEDWNDIRQRIEKLKEFGYETQKNTGETSPLIEWSKIIGLVLDEFVNSYKGKVDTDFWNRVTMYMSGGSGSSYMEGWILAFAPFTEDGEYILNNIDEIRSTNKFGCVETVDIPMAGTEVPVIIDDNGTKYKTNFYAGAYMSTFDLDTNTIGTSLDWAISVLPPVSS